MSSLCFRTPSGDSRRAFLLALLETAGYDGDGESLERARVQRLSLLSMEKVPAEIGVGLDLGKRRIGRKKQRDVREIRGSGILMKKGRAARFLAERRRATFLFFIFGEL
ncbi:hypothetical protein ACFX2I_011203 [Malus domestica]